MFVTGKWAMTDQRPCVILVDDDTLLRRSTQLVLQGRGFDVWAYAAAEMVPLDGQIAQGACLVADYCLEGWNGIGLLAALRGTGWQGPAILTTGFSTPELRRRAEATGFAAFLEKPIPETVLVRTIALLTRQPLHHAAYQARGSALRCPRP